MRHVLTVTAACVLLSACGGSGGGGAGSTYLGVNDYALLALDDSDANGVVSSAFQGVASGNSSDASDEAASDVPLASGNELMRSYMPLSLSDARVSQSQALDCADGGSKSRVFDMSEIALSLSGTMSVRFDQCDEYGTLQDGSMAMTFSGLGGTSSDMRVVFNNMKTTEDGETDVMDGDFRIVSSSDGNTHTSTMTSGRLNMVSDTLGDTVISNMSMVHVINLADDSYSLNIGYDLASDELNGRVNVATPLTMQYGASESYPVTGQMVISGAGGSSISLDANTGDLSTVLQTVFNGASTTAETVAWSSIDNGDLVAVGGF